MYIHSDVKMYLDNIINTFVETRKIHLNWVVKTCKHLYSFEIEQHLFNVVVNVLLKYIF